VISFRGPACVPRVSPCTFCIWVCGCLDCLGHRSFRVLFGFVCKPNFIFNSPFSTWPYFQTCVCEQHCGGLNICVLRKDDTYNQAMFKELLSQTVVSSWSLRNLSFHVAIPDQARLQREGGWGPLILVDRLSCFEPPTHPTKECKHSPFFLFHEIRVVSHLYILLGCVFPLFIPPKAGGMITPSIK
jgi:hypothetical protein